MPDAATLLAAVVPAAAPAAGQRAGLDAAVEPAFGKLLLASASLGTAEVGTKAGVTTNAASAPPAVKEAALPAAEDAMLRLMLAKLSDAQDQGTKSEPPPGPDTITPTPLAALLSEEPAEASATGAPAKPIDPQPELSPADAAQAALASVVAPPPPAIPVQPVAGESTITNTAPEVSAPEDKAAAASPAPAADDATAAAAAAPPANDTTAAAVSAPPAPANVSAEIAKTLLPTTTEAASQALTAVLSQLKPGAKTEPVTPDTPPKSAVKVDASTATAAKVAADAASAETHAPAAAQGPAADIATSAATRPPTQIHPAGATPVNDVAASGSFDMTAPQSAGAHASAGSLDQSLPVVVVRAPASSNPMLAANLPTSQIAVAIARQMRQGANRFEIRLDPPELGRIDVRMEVSHEGRVMASLAADRPETLDLLQRDARALQRAFADAGLQANADSLNFSLRDGSARQSKDFDGKSAGLTGRDGATDADPLPAYAARLEPGRLDMRV